MHSNGDSIEPAFVTDVTLSSRKAEKNLRVKQSKIKRLIKERMKHKKTPPLEWKESSYHQNAIEYWNDDRAMPLPSLYRCHYCEEKGIRCVLLPGRSSCAGCTASGDISLSCNYRDVLESMRTFQDEVKKYGPRKSTSTASANQ